uniref:F-box domain-containing protein n=1 Tax=Pyramimonas obovata TaxID=1411642 RepID=A0A7S0QVW1_9CHLO
MEVLAPHDEGEQLYARLLLRSRSSSTSSRLSELSDGPSRCGEECGLEDLPDALLAKVMSHLPGTALARMCVQNRRCRDIAGEPGFWKRVCLSQWPDRRPALYNGDWKDMYRQRVGLPTTFISLLDRVHVLHHLQKAPDNTYDVLEQVMQCLFSVGLLCANEPSLRTHVEFLALCADLQCWVRSEVDGGTAADHMALRSYLRTTRAYLNEYDFWTGRFIHWPNVPWRRSAIAYLFEMVNTPSKAIELADLHSDEFKELDDAISSAAEEADLTVAPPLGMPQSHWWYFLTPNYLPSRC